VSQPKNRQATSVGVMIGSMYLPSVTELFLAHQPPIYLITGRGAPMQLAAEAAPFRRLCDVYLKPACADVLTVRKARASHAEMVDAAPHSAEGSAGEKLHKASRGGRL
jgi:CBS domain containing-hemolysin-like protein